MTSAALPVQAVSFVSQRNALDANDQIDWATFFDDVPGPFQFLDYSFTGKSENNLGYSVDIPKINNLRFTSPLVFSVTPSIPVNLSLGDAVLFTGFIPGAFPATGNPGPITIKFDRPVLGVGTQFGVDDTDTYTAFIQAFDAQDQLLGSFSTPGISSLEIDNSAAFLGVENEFANIAKIVIGSDVPNRALGINFVSIRYATVPEPATILALSLLGMSLLATKPKIASRH